MFDCDPVDLTRTLAEMERHSRLRTNFDQPAARDLMAQWLKQDRRFDGYDADRLVKRVADCRASGAVLDLTDPVLRGQPRRPLDKSGW